MRLKFLGLEPSKEAKRIEEEAFWSPFLEFNSSRGEQNKFRANRELAKLIETYGLALSLVVVCLCVGVCVSSFSLESANLRLEFDSFCR